MATRREHLSVARARYRTCTSRAAKAALLDEVIGTLGYNRKYAIRVLGQPNAGQRSAVKRRRARRYLEALPAIELVYSRWVYVELTVSQDMATFVGCHRRALAAAGGVRAEIVYDNAKTVTISRVGHVVQFSDSLLRLAAGYGFRPRACWVHDPESKGRVENRIRFLKRSRWYGYEASTLEVASADVRRWCQEVANGEVCTATGVPPQVGLADEAPALRPLPVAAVEIAVVDERHVSKTGIIHWLGNEYSVPDRVQR